MFTSWWQKLCLISRSDFIVLKLRYSSENYVRENSCDSDRDNNCKNIILENGLIYSPVYCPLEYEILESYLEKYRIHNDIEKRQFELLVKELIIDLNLMQPLLSQAYEYRNNVLQVHNTIYTYLKTLQKINQNYIIITYEIDISIRQFLIYLTSLNFESDFFKYIYKNMKFSIKCFIINLKFFLELIINHRNYRNPYLTCLLV